MTIAETERLVLREINSATDAEFTLRLLNSPKFLQFIGDRGVRTAAEAVAFIETRYRQSYIDHGYGLYTVVLKADATPIGICGFVRRDSLPHPDLGFAFLPEFEGRGYCFESAKAALDHGRQELGFTRVLAITDIDNHASGHLLKKLGFVPAGTMPMPDGDVKLYNIDLLD